MLTTHINQNMLNLTFAKHLYLSNSPMLKAQGILKVRDMDKLTLSFCPAPGVQELFNC